LGNFSKFHIKITTKTHHPSKLFKQQFIFLCSYEIERNRTSQQRNFEPQGKNNLCGSWFTFALYFIKDKMMKKVSIFRLAGVIMISATSINQLNAQTVNEMEQTENYTFQLSDKETRQTVSLHTGLYGSAISFTKQFEMMNVNRKFEKLQNLCGKRQ
jgi:hypothetical protein